ncbi:hypothetical protein [Ignicoccus hospitalis]|uniref:hypothetical protein n=1 Tax=Ignicoccus hospitalis TaxID=160233 RepID=UPI00164F08DD|nr:hypothetical protein [Ignicoccus hospitalis]HIH90438.1 hypothetical protein [Desulfurococcaceae archaeon]
MRSALALVLIASLAWAHAFSFELLRPELAFPIVNLTWNNETYTTVYFFPKSIKGLF